jgi:hypothetical protein
MEQVGDLGVMAGLADQARDEAALALGERGESRRPSRRVSLDEAAACGG